MPTIILGSVSFRGDREPHRRQVCTVVSSAVSPFRDAVSSSSPVDPHRGHDTVAAELYRSSEKLTSNASASVFSCARPWSRRPSGANLSACGYNKDGWMGGARAEPAAYRGHSGQHYAATAWAVGSLVDRQGRADRAASRRSGGRTAPRSVVAGLSRRVVGVVPGAGPSQLVTIAGREAAHLAQSEGTAAVDGLLEAGAKRVGHRAPVRGLRCQGRGQRAYEGGNEALAQGQVPGWTDSENSWRRGI
jgi:hypothetical protein